MVYIQFPIEDSGFWNLLPVEKKSEGRDGAADNIIALVVSGRVR